MIENSTAKPNFFFIRSKEKIMNCVNCCQETVVGIAFNATGGRRMTIPLCLACIKEPDKVRAALNAPPSPLGEGPNRFWKRVIAELGNPTLEVLNTVEKAIDEFFA